MSKFLIAFIFFLFTGASLTAQDFFSITTESKADFIDKNKEYIKPERKVFFNYDYNSLRSILRTAPQESYFDRGLPGLKLHLPNPEGGLTEFDIYESPILSEPEYSQFPNIRTYIAVNQANKIEHGRIDITEHGFHGLIFTDGDVYLIEPASLGNRQSCITYYKKDNKIRPDFECMTEGSGFNDVDLETRTPLSCNSSMTLVSYRTAVACTWEYSNFHGGTVALTLSAITTTVNRVSAVYEKDMGARLILIPQNSSILYTTEGGYTASTDPYTNDDGGLMLGENQTVLRSVIGAPNYDIGHVVSTGGGGVAWLAVVCFNTPGTNNSNNANLKALGVTGASTPVGDYFDIDYVAHEIGHQFGANHAFNGNTGSCSGNRNGSTAYEPGSGSTIMSYAGICGAQNIQPHSDPYFHWVSMGEALTHINTTTSCRTAVSGTNNTTPQITSFTTGKTIPANTPFYLDASATDADGDAITYCWEENDLGTAGNINASSTTAPIFRSFNPVSSGRRYFPRLHDVLNNTTTYGEVLPSVARTLKFTITARDNHATGGGICRQSSTITVVASSGFKVTAPNVATTWSSPGTGTITWDVAGTASSPISCANVDVQVSFDNGLSWTSIGVGVPNNGSFIWTIPSGINSSDVRFRVRCSDNIFYAVNTVPITIGNPVNTCYTYTNNSTLTIPLTPSTVTSSIIISNRAADEIVKDINITNLNVTHSNLRDLRFKLKSSNGASNILMDSKCSGYANINIGFDDEAVSGTLPCPPTNGGAYKPQEFLNVHDGMPANGQWDLEIDDWYSGNGGSLNSWSVQICVEKKTPLPLHLLSFAAEAVKIGVYIGWTTSNEREVEVFTVERMAHDGSFRSIGHIPAKNIDAISNYGLVDEYPDKGINYYRLKMIGKNGKVSYSEIKSVRFEGRSSVTIFPNPTNGILSIKRIGNEGEIHSINILDLSGREVMSLPMRLHLYELKDIDVSSLIPGMYLVQVNMNTGVETIPFIKS
ncbi:MAG: T9SS type A sorting domain-containing protein [Saprospiraceae bacterium]|nr:T9SS type A sorting domain-containing protein [Saprospiraceae bacterium]MBX7179497.1 T9SS type A sorting domain-containing protein [Saprospiraceae bacterium]MCB0590429.1 T9SS type A sorting domain-containing protein [Saprospiraceae bacterium]MCO5282652.1 M12 family metallo-peptidase [Saprospiraceae bacterium]MCO6469354.1 T9SS type A sorting domain-containing protein [Saprospiraceae bacterium]